MQTITQNKNVVDIQHYIMKKYISKVNTTDKSMHMSTYLYYLYTILNLYLIDTDPKDTWNLLATSTWKIEAKKCNFQNPIEVAAHSTTSLQQQGRKRTTT